MSAEKGIPNSDLTLSTHWLKKNPVRNAIFFLKLKQLYDAYRSLNYLPSISDSQFVFNSYF